MKKACVKIITFIMTALFFTACEKTPERESSSVVVTEPASNKELVKFVNLDVARREVDELRGKKYLNLTLPENIFVTKEDQISEYTAHWIQDDCSVFTSIVEKIWDDFHYMDLDNDYCQILSNHNLKGYERDAYTYYHKDNPDDEYLAAIENEDNEYILYNSDYCFITTTWGSFCGSSHNLLRLDLDGAGFSKVAEYNILWGDVPDNNEYEVEGGKMTINDVVKLVEKRSNDALEYLSCDVFEYKVAYVTVYKSENSGLHIFDIVTNRFVGDIPVDPCNRLLNNVDKNWGKAIAGKGMYYFRVMKKDEISFVNEPEGESIKVYDPEVTDQIISFKYAISIIKEQIATIGMNKIQQCGLVYLFSCDTVWQGNVKGYTSFGFLGYNKKIEDSVRMRPYWLFALKGNKLRHGASILVDAIDGTVYYYDYTY